MPNLSDEQLKELIAVGASVGAHCQPCLTYHVGKAKELGLDAGQIRVALDVGQMVEKGALAAMREFAKGVLEPVNPTGAASCAGQPQPGGKQCCG